ncbi:MFS transporter [Jiangella mangrovi]|uniref:MFS family permease n=1 Tax=Jiangella mangrovi TaxID=1524084 RepID=A0A7W9GX47_9ACTN|nr:MFS transporter [Jiangella mangrovi]MBB5791673.1 MFS family permease [Jiangella mangrovi]
MPKAREALALIGICVAAGTVLANATTVIVALPDIGTTWSMQTTDLAWVLNAYNVPFGALLLTGGRLADRLGQRRVLLMGIGVFGASSLLCAVAWWPGVLYAGRAAQGVAAGLVVPTGLAMLAVIYGEGPRREHAMAIWATIGACSGSVGLLSGGLLTEVLAWRAIFAANVVLAVVSIALARFVRRDDVDHSESFDVAGAVTLTIGLLAFVLGVSTVRTDRGQAAVALSATVAGAVLLLLFVGLQRRSAHPLIPLGALRVRNLAIANTAMFIVVGCPAVAMYLLTLYYQEIHAASTLVTAFLFLPVSVAVVIGSMTARSLSGRTSTKRILCAACVLVFAGSVLFTRLGEEQSYLTEALPALVPTFVGMGGAFVCLTSLATRTSHESDLGFASGLISASQQIGAGFWLALLSATALGTFRVGSGEATELLGRFDRVFMTLAVMALTAAALVIAFVRSEHERPRLKSSSAD